VQIAALFSLLLALLVCIVLGANNASVCVGTSGGVVSRGYFTLATVAALGAMLGSVVEGGKLSNAIYGGVLVSQSSKATPILLLTTLVVMLVASIVKLPLSLTQAMVGVALPVGILLNIGVKWTFAILVASSWVATPFVAAVASIAIYHVVKHTSGKIGSVFQRARVYAAITLSGSFYVGYALGANGVGLVNGISQSTIDNLPLFSAFLSVATIAGIYAFGYRVTRTVSERILALTGAAALAAQLGGALTVHLFTQLGFPVSITQAIIGGITGIGQAKDIAIMNRRIILRIILGWIIAPLTGMGLAWLILTLL
jgi:PiT family inorganic phosphate transporter